MVKNLPARRVSQEAIVVNTPSATAGDLRDTGSIPGSGRSPGGGHGDPLQDSCLENPIDTGAWQASVQRVTQSQTRLKQLSMQARAPGRKRENQEAI